MTPELPIRYLVVLTLTQWLHFNTEGHSSCTFELFQKRKEVERKLERRKRSTRGKSKKCWND